MIEDYIIIPVLLVLILAVVFIFIPNPDDKKRSNPGRKTEKENVSTDRENVYPEKE